MNKFQEQFLAELLELCEKYRIDFIYFESGHIRFKSNGQTLGFQKMELETFVDVETQQDAWSVHDEQDI